MNVALRLPPAFRKKLGQVEDRRPVYSILRRARLNTVCEEARCPNIGECFANQTATFMILGDRCTRRCHFCSVKTGRPNVPDEDEPEKLAGAADTLGLDYVVITSVDRDDLKDHGAAHFAKCILAIKRRMPHATVELLTPDFKGKKPLIDVVLSARPDVFGHNTETVRRLYRNVRPQSHFDITREVLRYVASTGLCKVKSGMMVGLGESDDEVVEELIALRQIGVHVVTIGQYLRPSLKHWEVHRYVEESSYVRFREVGKKLGFDAIYAAPFVRSSYHAKETFLQKGAKQTANLQPQPVPEEDQGCISAR